MRASTHALCTAAAAGALLTALCAPRESYASPPEIFGYGARSSAMGGLGASFVDDYAAVYLNPAGLTRARERSVTLGLAGASFAVGVARGADAGLTRTSIERARGMILGVALPIPLPGPVLRDRLAIGVALQLPFDVIGRHRVLRPETPQFSLLANRTQSIALMAGVGVRLPWGLRIGGGGAASATLSGNLSVANDAFGVLGYRIDDRILVNYAPVVGASWDHEASGLLHVGASFRGTLVGGLNVEIIARDLGINLPPFNVSGMGQYDPWQVSLEVALTPGRWLFAVGATFKRWSEYPGPLVATTPMSPAPPPPGFADTLVVRAGVEHRWAFGASHVAVRGGYFYEPSPVPEQRGVSNYLDNDRHVGTVGASVGGRFGGTALTMEVFGQVHGMPERTHAKDPAAMIPVDNPGYPSLRSGGVIGVLGVTGTVSL